MYDELHCPFCGSTNIYDCRESFNYKAAFWGLFFFYIVGGLLFGLVCRKRIECHCNECGSDFSFYY